MLYALLLGSSMNTGTSGAMGQGWHGVCKSFRAGRCIARDEPTLKNGFDPQISGYKEEEAACRT